MELGFTLGDQFTPSFRWRSAHFQHLSVFSQEIKTAIARLVEVKDVEDILSIARSIESEIKSVLRSMFSVRCGQRTDLSMYAHAIKRKIRNKQVKDMTNLDWWGLSRMSKYVPLINHSQPNLQTVSERKLRFDNSRHN